MPDKRLFDRDPRKYAWELLDEGIPAETLLTACLLYMSHADCRDMLDANEMSPRFGNEDDAD